MPTNSETHHGSDCDRGSGRDGGKEGSKQKATFKSKDLSHVPCKFHKFGRCAAGSLCPFSHGSVEPQGPQKETCRWFIKGNCKFGHKCVLAHVLPGQSMAMDRKNKKAPRTTTSGASGEKDGKPGSGATRREAATPTSSVSSQSLPLSLPKRERSILHRAAEGRLLVPDVKLKVHNALLNSAWCGPASPSSRRGVCNPLSAPIDSDEDTETGPSALAKNIKVKRRPVENTRSWSYNNVKTYDIMQVPQKKVKKMEKQIQLIDGEEVEVEVFRAPISKFLHSRDQMTVDSGYSWGELLERKKNFHTASFKRDVTLDVELKRPPHVHLPSSSRDRPDLMQSKNLNVSASCILPSSVGKFNNPTLSLVNADAHTDGIVLPPDESPPETRFWIPIPSKKIRFLNDHEDGQSLLKYILHDNLRSRRRVVNSASTAGSRPSPMIAGASDPFTPEIH